MRYKAIDELPDSVRNHLPEHAQEIYREAFNHAWEEYADRENGETLFPRRGLPPGRMGSGKLYDKDEKTGHWKKK